MKSAGSRPKRWAPPLSALHAHRQKEHELLVSAGQVWRDNYSSKQTLLFQRAPNSRGWAPEIQRAKIIAKLATLTYS